MCSILSRFRRFAAPRRKTGIHADERGIVAPEFAIISPLLIIMIIGIFELGTIMLVNSLMEGAMRDASRYGITGREEEGVTREDYIRQMVDEKTLGFVDMDNVSLETLVYPDFGSIGDGETYVDGNGNGDYDEGETFTDTNDNGIWDSDIGEVGAGGADDVVLYRVRYDWEIMTPFFSNLLGSDGAFALQASIAVRNEPWE